MQRRIRKWISMGIAVIFVVGCSVLGDGEALFAEKLDVKEGAVKKETQQNPMSDSGVKPSALEDVGVDLVVSKVVIQRGDFPTGRTVKVTPYVKNMCNGNVTGSIKVSLPELETVMWIRDGIRPKEEKSAGSLYYCELSGCDIGAFSVVVDGDNEIEENNESNNRCIGITFMASETDKTHCCPIQGPR